MKAFTIPLVRQNRLKYVPGLDGLRGIAVWAVIFYHCFPSLIIARIGWAGVDLFFVLSGFLITGILYDTKPQPNYYKNFIARRMLRIFPLYYFVLAILFFVVPNLFPGLMGPHFDYYREHQSYFWLYIQNWLYSANGFPENHILVHFWSLSVEEQFYIFWPLIVKLCPRKHLLKLSSILILFSIFYRMNLGFLMGLKPTYQYMATLSRMDGLLIGAVVAVLLRQHPSWLEKIVIPTLILSFVPILTGIAIIGRVNFLSLPSLYTFLDLFSAALLLLCLSIKKIPILTRLVNHKALIWTGKYSYGLYVYHYIIFMVLTFNFGNKLSEVLGSGLISEIVVGIVTIILSLITSYLSYQYLEAPFLGLKRYFSHKKQKLLTLQPEPIGQ